MCIKTTGFETLKSDLKVWKVCRHSKKGDWYLSYFPPAWRYPQSIPYTTEFINAGIWQGLPYFLGGGATKRYYVGRTHRSKDPGMYCFRIYDHARQFVDRGHNEKVILECTIPAGTEVINGLYDAGDTVVTPILHVDKLLNDFKWMYHYESPNRKTGWVDLVATST